MSATGKIKWDQTGQRKFEAGVDHGVLYPVSEDGTYPKGVAWNGLTTVTESPSGAEATPVYADNIKYLNLFSAEEYKATIEAVTYPDEWEACDGSTEVATGATIGQQDRQGFGLCYRTLIGNDTKDTKFGYKLHLIWGCKASPSEKSHNTVNESLPRRWLRLKKSYTVRMKLQKVHRLQQLMPDCLCLMKSLQF